MYASGIGKFLSLIGFSPAFGISFGISFGASTQILAALALALIGVTVWLWKTAKNLKAWIPKTPGIHPAIPILAAILVVLSVMVRSRRSWPWPRRRARSSRPPRPDPLPLSRNAAKGPPGEGFPDGPFVFGQGRSAAGQFVG